MSRTGEHLHLPPSPVEHTRSRLHRAAQRAFRERKQSQLAELQARVQQYEAGEIERNVALQNIAKRLKEENDKLRKENALLKEKLSKYESDRGSGKRSRDESSPQPAYDLGQSPAKKRSKASIDLSAISQSPFPPASYASSPSTLSSTDSEGHTSYSPMSVSRDTPVFSQNFGLNGIFDMATSGKTSLFELGGSLEGFDCGFCNENGPCVCRELALQQVAERMSMPNMKMEAIEPQHPSPLMASPMPMQPHSNILDNLPAYQPAIPLRRRNPPNPSLQPIFPISLPKPEMPTCTGDPSNCAACADDAFGKAFCAEISKSVACASPCKDCPSRSVNGGGCGGNCASNGGVCCGNPSGCGSSGDYAGPSTASSAAAQLTSSLLMSEPLTSSETISCDVAWRQIKSHPNVAFSDLSLLAEVVARRSKCTGPRVEITPAPGTITPERGLSPGVGLASFAHTTLDNQAIILTDPHAQYHERQRMSGTASPPNLIPQDVLVKCGRQRVREVMADGVRDALRLLDSGFATS